MEAVRPATTQDHQRVLELLQELIAATSVPRSEGRFNVEQRRLSLADRLADSGRLTLVGTVDGYVVALALVSVDVADNTVALLEEIYVEPGFREIGLGELLVDGATSWARRQGCASIEFSALPGDRSSKNLAERSGFRARQIVMHRKL